MCSSDLCACLNFSGRRDGFPHLAKKPIPNFDAEPGPRVGSAHWRLGAFELDERLRELSRDGQPVPLESKPLSLLMLLLRHPGEVVSKQEVAEALWPGQAASDAVT